MHDNRCIGRAKRRWIGDILELTSHFVAERVRLANCRCRWRDSISGLRSSAASIRGGSRNLHKGGRAVPFLPLPSLSPLCLLPRFPPSSPLFFPLEVGSPLKQLEGLGDRCKLPSGARGEALADNKFSAL